MNLYERIDLAHAVAKHMTGKHTSLDWCPELPDDSPDKNVLQIDYARNNEIDYARNIYEPRYYPAWTDEKSDDIL